MVYSMRIFLCFVIVLFTANGFAVTEEKLTHQTFSLNAGGTIELGNVHGDVIIRGWDEDQVDMKATKRGPAKNLDLVEIEIDSSPERLSIDTKYPRHYRNTNASVRYELMVPRKTVLDTISNVNGEIEIYGVEGQIRISTVNGSAEIEGSKSSVEAQTVNGNISAKWSDFPKQSGVRMETVNGGVELQLPPNIDANLIASSLNGSIQTDFPVMIQGKFLSREISGKIGEGGSSIDVSTINGSIKVLKTSQ